MKKKLATYLHGRARVGLVGEGRKLYSSVENRREIEEIQTERFNNVWNYSWREVPFYSHWRSQFKLPAEIRHIGEVAEFPVLSKGDLRERAELVSNTPGIEGYYTSGGSTGEPIRIPRGRCELDHIFSGNYIGRSWSGIELGDPYVHLWGHAHLTGIGRSATLTNISRRLKDWVGGGVRINAYIQTRESAREYIKKIERHDPAYLVGYTSALVWLAESVTSEGGIDAKRLHAVIVTAETVSPNDIAAIKRAFHVPVVIEYGAAEVGVIGYSSKDDSSMKVLWGSVVVNSSRDAEVRATTIYPRVFPMINYNLGDIAISADTRENLLRLDGIVGRSKDVVRLRIGQGDPIEVHVRVFRKVLLSVPDISVVQFVEEPSGVLRILLRSESRLDLDEISSHLVREISKLVIPIEQSAIILEQTDRAYQTRAGKLSSIVSYECWRSRNSG